MALKAISDTAGYDGLIPVLLVLRAYPPITSSDMLAPTITERTRAIKAAMAEVIKMHAARQVKNTLKQRNGPRSYDFHNISISSDTLAWRSHQKQWTDPLKSISVLGGTC